MPLARVLPLAAALALALGGCVTHATQQDVTTYALAGSHEAALAAGAGLTKARTDPAGGTFPSLALAAPDLDAAWGPGAYALTAIHWWGPPGAPAAQGTDGDAVHLDGSAWQGFLVDATQLQLVPGDVDAATQRSLGDRFLQNVTGLGPAQRAAYLDGLLARCDFLACTAPVPDALDARRAWDRVGGHDGAQRHETHAGGRLAAGDWWFQFDVDVATLVTGAGEGHAILEVGANDVATFSWRSGQTHGDEESYARLRDVLEPRAIPVPDAGDLAWEHGPIPTD